MVVHPELLASVWGEGLPGPLVRLGWARPSYVGGGVSGGFQVSPEIGVPP